MEKKELEKKKENELGIKEELEKYLKTLVKNNISLIVLGFMLLVFVIFYN